MREMGKLPPGWRIKELLPDDPAIAKHTKEAAEIAKELAAIPRVINKPPTHFNGKLVAELSTSEREEFILSLQQPSTQAALKAQMERDPSEDFDHLLRPMPDCLANPEATSLDELTAMREIPFDQVLLIEGSRRKSKNTIGQSEKSSVSPERREKGIHAFHYSRPAEIKAEDIKRIKELNGLKAVVNVSSEEIPQEAPKLTLRERMRLWFDQKFGDWLFYGSDDE